MGNDLIRRLPDFILLNLCCLKLNYSIQFLLFFIFIMKQSINTYNYKLHFLTNFFVIKKLFIKLNF